MSSLPHPPGPFRGRVGRTYAESEPDWPVPVRPPADAPNVVVIMFDDLGFGQLDAYGGPCLTPNIRRLAERGLRYTNFHTTSLCSPSRAALLTGRNHHAVGFAAIAEMASGFPGYNSFLPRSAATIAEVLRLNGYSTYCTGKWHLTPTAEATAAGPFDRWPLGMGFERFYGFLPGATDHWHPVLTEDNHRVPVPERDGYHLSEDLVDHAIAMVRDQQQVASGRPFFLYLPFGAVHCPFHAPAPYIDAYRGRFDEGWDVERLRSFERQKQMGIIPAGSDLPPRNPGVRPWDSLDATAQAVYARLMEAFAGMADHADAQIGRLVGALEEMGVLDDTLLMVLSDNGASQEGQRHGSTNTERFRNLMPMTPEEMAPVLDGVGGPGSDPHYPAGWAMAGNAPFRRYKRDTHRGGNTDPLIVHWPAAVGDAGGLRRQYLHITDLYPTLLEVAGLEIPTRVHGVEQKPIEGFSFAETIRRPDAGESRTTQYYEMLGSRALYHDGWMAVTWHRPGTDWSEDVWELYDQRNDFTQAHDLAEKQPGRLEEMIDLWWSEARAHDVLPLDDRGFDRFIDPTRPAASEDRDVYRYHPGTSPVPNPSLPVFLNCPHSFTVHFTMRRPDDAGLLVSQGANLGGWALCVIGGKALYINNYLQLSTFVAETDPLPVGRRLALRAGWEPLEPGVGTLTLHLDGTEVCREERVPSAPRGYSMVQEGLCVGRSWGPSVSSRHYSGRFEFTGQIHVVELVSDPAAQLKLG